MDDRGYFVNIEPRDALNSRLFFHYYVDDKTGQYLEYEWDSPPGHVHQAFDNVEVPLRKGGGEEKFRLRARLAAPSFSNDITDLGDTDQVDEVDDDLYDEEQILDDGEAPLPAPFWTEDAPARHPV
ncbi:hypothetical protein LTR08_005589 [Meristemomyces frigidus]|nr:hypothetical protein LTR08_005589 [Meristemomyces frigidus]